VVLVAMVDITAVAVLVAMVDITAMVDIMVAMEAIVVAMVG